MTQTPLAMALLALAAAFTLLLSGCSSMGGSSMNSGSMGGMYTLTFQGNGTFHGPHGGQAIHVALIDADTGKVVAKQEGTVSRSAVPSFSFTFAKELTPGTDYDVDYWIDSNFGGGTKGVCDAPKHDHQWQIKLGKVDGNVTHVETHEPAKITPVCSVFGTM